jgi:hypothetical protein
MYYQFPRSLHESRRSENLDCNISTPRTQQTQQQSLSSRGVYERQGSMTTVGVFGFFDKDEHNPKVTTQFD